MVNITKILKILFKLKFVRNKYYWIIEKANKYNLLQKSPVITRFNNIKIKLNPEDWIQQQILFLGLYDSEALETEFWKNILIPGQTVIDIGANIGYYSLITGNILKNNGMIYSFEPSLKNYTRLLENIALNNFSNIIPINKALSNEEIKRNLYISDSKNWGMTRFSTHESFKGEMELVDCIKFDNFAKENAIKTVDLIKIDVEGAELLVLKGMEETLKNTSPMVLIEVNNDTATSMNSNISEIYLFMASFAFSPFEIITANLLRIIKKPIVGRLIVFMKEDYKIKSNIKILNE